MTKKIKLGLSAMVAFAMMFATSVSVVAQERINSNSEQSKYEVATKNVAKNQQIMNGTVDISKKASVFHWYKIDANGNVESYLGQFDIADIETETDGCDNQGSSLCAVGYADDPELDTGNPPTGDYESWNRSL